MKLEETNVIDYLRDPRTREAIVDAIADNLSYYQNLDTDERALDYSGSIYNWFLGECVLRNQYAVFTENQYRRIHELYKRFVFGLRGLTTYPVQRPVIDRIVSEHRKDLIVVLQEVSGLSVRRDTILPCAEYGLSLQKSVLRIVPEELPEPILDIGCGKKALLVNALRKDGKDAVGIDQYLSSGDGILCKSWLEFEYLPNFWGSVIAHMSFSNHFIHALGGDASLAERYRRTYGAILASLKAGGSFSYAPALRDAESALDGAEFRVEYFENVAGKRALDTVRVTRLKQR